MQQRAKQNKEMPEKMGPFFFQRKRNNAKRVGKSAAENIEKERHIIPNKTGKKNQPRPAQSDKEGCVQPFGTPGTKDANQGNSSDNDDPLKDTEKGAGLSGPEHKPHRGESTADQEINGNVVKTAPEPFYPGSMPKSMIKTAHQEKKNQAGTINNRGKDFDPGVGFQQQKDDSHDAQPGADTVCHGIADFLKHGSPWRLVDHMPLVLSSGFQINHLSPHRKGNEWDVSVYHRIKKY